MGFNPGQLFWSYKHSGAPSITEGMEEDNSGVNSYCPLGMHQAHCLGITADPGIQNRQHLRLPTHEYRQPMEFASDPIVCSASFFLNWGRTLAFSTLPT